MSKTTIPSDTALFSKKLVTYKQAIDRDIAAYSKHLRSTTLKDFGANARLAMDAYLSVLERGGKRIRGALVMAAYEMCGGQNKRVALETARALEMLHAYILIVDDFQDKSATRRGGPTAHKLLAQHHTEHEWGGSAEHFGASIALNAALCGGHAAQQVLASLDVPAVTKLAVLQTVNYTMMVTAHGQTNDIVNEVVAEVPERDIERVLEWKTAHYTFLNPLRVGMLLAGATNKDVDTIRPYAMNAGKAFQITDDILGTFGTEFDSGKSPMDDIREGKRTLLVAYALEHTSAANKNFLVQMLGNTNLTPIEFERCKTILTASGALDYAQQAAEQYITLATQSLEQLPAHIDHSGKAFLSGLARHLAGRTA